MTIHDLDMARFLLAEEPIAVSAHASVLVEPELAGIGDFDSATVILETASGKQAVITNSRRAAYDYDQRVEAHGSLGVASAENEHERSVVVGTAESYSRPAPLDFFTTRHTASYAGEMAAFVDGLVNVRTALRPCASPRVVASPWRRPDDASPPPSYGLRLNRSGAWFDGAERPQSTLHERGIAPHRVITRSACARRARGLGQIARRG